MNLTHSFLDAIPLWGVFLVSLMTTFASIEFGFRMGKRKRRRLTGEEKVNTAPFATAALSLLAFMLAIVFGAVDSRVNEVKHVALNEANAIGSAFALADVLPEADRLEVQRLLYDYVTLLVEAAQNGTAERFEQAADQAGEIQNDLWSKAFESVARQPTPISALLLDSLDEVSDLYETRITLGIRYRLAGLVWIVLFGLAIVALTLGGYDNGLSRDRNLPAVTLSAAVAFSVVILMVVALDRPEQHLSATQAVLLDTREDIRHSMESRP